MTSVVQFAPRQPSRQRRAAETGREADIVIFPGVRYERPQVSARTESPVRQTVLLPEKPVQRH